MKMKRLGVGGLEFLPQFYDGFYIQPPGLYWGKMFLAYLFRCFAGFENDIAPKLEELSANGSIVLQMVIQIAYSGIMLGIGIAGYDRSRVYQVLVTGLKYGKLTLAGH